MPARCETGMARVSGGKRFANGVDFAVSGTMEGSEGDNRLYFPAFDTAATNNGVADDLDGERVGNVYGHLTAGNFALTAAFGNRRKVVPTASFGSIFNEQDDPERTTDRRTFIAGQYNTTLGGTHLVVDSRIRLVRLRGTVSVRVGQRRLSCAAQPGRRARAFAGTPVCAWYASCQDTRR